MPCLDAKTQGSTERTGRCEKMCTCDACRLAMGMTRSRVGHGEDDLRGKRAKESQGLGKDGQCGDSH